MVYFKVVHGRIGTDIWANSRLKIIEELVEGKGNKILDYGCGPGYMGKLFSKNNDVIFADMEKDELRTVGGDSDRLIIDARYAPLKKEQFDYVICAGVMEHIVEDELVLQNIYSLLRKGGKAIITLPAYSFMYGKHDEYIDHHRRYDRGPFIKMAKETGFTARYHKYSNSLMFLPFLLSNIFLSQVKTYKGKSRIENRIIPFLNFVCNVEKRLRFPFGIGLIFVLEK